MAAAPSTGVKLAPGATSYEAIHNHRISGCKGRLLASVEQMSYESVDSVSHPGRWEFKSIKELKQDNPYSLEISPFCGGGYNFNLGGTGMGSDAFRLLVDRRVRRSKGCRACHACLPVCGSRREIPFGPERAETG